MDRWIKNNTVVKILAIAVSILLWGMVHTDDVTPTPTSTIDTTFIENVKVQPFGLDDSLYVLNTLDTDRVRIEVKGKRSAITSIFNDDYKVTLDLSDIIEGTFTVPLSYELPSGVELVSMSPNKVTVTIEKKSEVSFPVSIVTSGSLLEGYVVGAILSDPNKVKVTLPNSDMQRVSKVQGIVKLDANKETIKVKKVKLVAIDSDGQEIKDAVIVPAEVAVEIPLISPSKSVSLKVQYTGNLPDGLELTNTNSNVSEVTLFGSREVLSQIELLNSPAVDLSKITTEGKSTLNVTLIPPEGVDKIEPSVIQVQVETQAVVNIESLGEITINDIPIIIEGISTDTQVAFVKPEGKSLSLTLTGTNTALNNLKKTDIKITANVSQLKLGTHEIPVEVNLPTSISLNSDKSLVVIVEVKDKDKVVPPVTNDKDKPVIEEPTDKNGTTEPVVSKPNDKIKPEFNTAVDVDRKEPST
ncbi:CdaR family protein [Paenibacillus sp. CMAA1364]